MGFLMDSNRILITFDLSSRNTNDCLTYRPIPSRIKNGYELDKIIIVADKGMTTGYYVLYPLCKGWYVFIIPVHSVDNKLNHISC